MEEKLKLAKYIVEKIEEKDMINLNSDHYEDVILRILVEFEEKHHTGEFSIEEKMRKLAKEADTEDAY